MKSKSPSCLTTGSRLDRIAAFGHGTPVEMESGDAVAIAKRNGLGYPPAVEVRAIAAPQIDQPELAPVLGMNEGMASRHFLVREHDLVGRGAADGTGPANGHRFDADPLQPCRMLHLLAHRNRFFTLRLARRLLIQHSLKVCIEWKLVTVDRVNELTASCKRKLKMKANHPKPKTKRLHRTEVARPHSLQ